MSTFAHSRVSPGNDALANTIVDKLRRLAPAAAAMSYPFLLNGFHLAVSVPGGSLSTARIIGAALCLLAAMAAPLIGLATAFRLTNAGPSFFELRARRLAYLSIGVPPLFVLTGVALGLLHLHISDELVWIVGWLAACVYVLLGSESVPDRRPLDRLASCGSRTGLSQLSSLVSSCFISPTISSAWWDPSFTRRL